MSQYPRHSERVSPEERYVDVQNGYPAIAILGATSGLTVLFGWVCGPTLFGTLFLLMQLFMVVCFSSLFIRANRWGVFWQFGPGWIRGTIPLCDIQSCEVVTDRFAYGWGIQKTPIGWRYCANGSSVLVIHRFNGRRVRLSTARAHELRRFINNAIDRQYGLS